MKPLEKTNNNIWIISGPAAVGKNYSVLEPLKKLNIPNLVVQDMDRLKDHYPDCVPDKNPKVTNVYVSAKRQDHVDAFFKQNKGKDIVLGGVGWMPTEAPLKFPEESKLIYLYRDPKVIAKDKYERDFPEHYALDEKSFMADIAKETADQFVLYEKRGWTKATADQVMKDIVSHYHQGGV
jgi:hypothetical protein